MPVSSSRKDASSSGRVSNVVSPKPLTISYPPYVCPPNSVYRVPDVSPGSEDHRANFPLETSSVYHSQYSSISPLSVLSTTGSDASLPCFNTLSPPLLNLSPNLSPSALEMQRMSPYYDLRESTRRQSSLYDAITRPQSTRSPQLSVSAIGDSYNRKTESPGRKRRRLSPDVESQMDGFTKWEMMTDSSLQCRMTAAPALQRNAFIGETGVKSRRKLAVKSSESSGRTMPGLPHIGNTMQTSNSRWSSSHYNVDRQLHQSHQQYVSWRAGIPDFAPASRRPSPRLSPQPQQNFFEPQVNASRPYVWSSACNAPCCEMSYPVFNTSSEDGNSLRPPVSMVANEVLQQQPMHLANNSSNRDLLQYATGGVTNTLKLTGSSSAEQHLSASDLSKYNTCQRVLDAPQVPTMQPSNALNVPFSVVNEQQPMAQADGLYGAWSQQTFYAPNNEASTRRLGVANEAPHAHGGGYNGLRVSMPCRVTQEDGNTAPYSCYMRSAGNRQLRRVAPSVMTTPYQEFFRQFMAMLGGPQSPTQGSDVSSTGTEGENYQALLNLAESLGDTKLFGMTQSEIDQLLTYRFNSADVAECTTQTLCVICMYDFDNRQMVRVLPCSHEFHAKCVDKWLKCNRTCPICRAEAIENSKTGSFLLTE